MTSAYRKSALDASEYAHMKSAYILTADIESDARQNMKVLHPLPRVDEITTDVDKHHTLTTSSKLKMVYTLAKPY